MPRRLIGDRRLTQRQKSARHREKFRRMDAALAAIDAARTLREAKRLARAAREPVQGEAWRTGDGEGNGE